MDTQDSTATTQNKTTVKTYYIRDEKFVVQFGPEVVRLIDDIQRWGIDRNITTKGGATGLSQIKKLRKELIELEAGLAMKDRHEVIDGIGDMLVVLVQIARLEGLTWDECLAQAWKDIKDRKGQMCCGIFVKEDDLKLPGLPESLNQCTTAQEVEDAIDLAKGITKETKENK